MPRETLNTSHFAIFDYWKNKCIDQCGNVFVEGDADYSKTEPVVYDWGEPCCWACDRPTNVWLSDNYDEMLQDETLQKLYKHPRVRGNLERAHIVARMHGGNDAPSNLFLLCSRCHRESPHLKNPTLFFAWVFKRRREPPFLKKVETEVSKRMEEMYGIKQPYIPIENMRDPKSNIAWHPGSDEFESMCYLSIDMAVENITGLNEEHDTMYREFLNRKIAELKQNGGDANLIAAYEQCLMAYETFKTIERKGVRELQERLSIEAR